jgi:hypothetical protein
MSKRDVLEQLVTKIQTRAKRDYGPKLKRQITRQAVREFIAQTYDFDSLTFSFFMDERKEENRCPINRA